MAGEAYIDRAVTTVAAHFETYLGTELDQVEADQSLDAGSMTEPERYLDYYAPSDNYGNPLFMAYLDGVMTPDEGGANRIYDVPVSTALIYHGLGDISADAGFMRRYATAMIRTVVNERDTLDGEVTACRVVGAEIGRNENVQFGDVSATRHVLVIGWSVLLSELEC